MAVAKYYGKNDILNSGSRSIGATNIYRVLGFKAALIVLGLDVLKGMLAIVLSYFVFLPNLLSPLVKFIFGLAVICGHNWSVFLKFRGGKGVATTLGVFLLIAPQTVFYTVLLWLGILLITRLASMASLSVSAIFPIMLYFCGGSIFEVIFAFICAVLIFWRHKDNLSRLLNGQEEHLSIKLF